MNENIFFSICITSYNRVNELARLLKSIDSSKYLDDIEVIVSEDKSPKKEEIQEVVERYKAQSHYRVIFNSNENNLGYDRNLGKLKELASGKFIIYMSDDDAFTPGKLDDYLDFLVKNDCSVCFQPFMGETGIRRKYNGHQYWQPSESTVANHIYDSILFSGLTFKRECIAELDAEPFLNSYYFQVYMFMTVAYKHGLHYYDSTLVDCIMDGENAYGKSDSSVKNQDLANRKSIYSNLEFNKGLIWVITRFDKENSTKCKDIFAKEYSIRTLPGMCRARRVGKAEYKEYIKRLESLDLKLSPVYHVYKIMISVFGWKLTQKMVKLPKDVLIRSRQKSN